MPMNDKIDPLQSLADMMVSLYGRWQDEKEYENFADYRVAFRKVLPAGWHLDSMTSRPFYAVLTDADGVKRFMKVTAREITWGRLLKSMKAN